MFGQEDTALEEKFDIPTTTQDRKTEIEEVIEFWNKLPEILNKKYENYRKYYNSKRKELTVKEGDKILVKAPFPLKMENTYDGPYEVKKVLGKSTISIIDNKGKHQKIHVSRIKKYISRNEDTRDEKEK